MKRLDGGVERWWENEYPMPSLKEEEAIRMFRIAVAGVIVLAVMLVASGIMAARWLGV